MKALQGIKVLDLTHALAGPFCTYQLGLLGADVLKIERPGVGDDFRAFARSPDWQVSPSFAAVNAGKRSVCIDLKHPAGQTLIRRIVREVDLVVENQRPGAMQQWGLSWDDLHPLNPKLIYCALSGFGQGGEMSRWLAYDHTIQAMSGMSWSGAPDDIPSHGRGFSVDCFSGYLAFAAILSALLRRERFGTGQFIDVSMLDASLVLMGVGLVRQVLTGDNVSAVQPISHDRPTVGAFATQDGWLWLSGNFQHHFEALCRVLGAPELIEDARYRTADLRSRNSAELRAELGRLIAPRRAADLERALMEAGAPAARVRTSREALDLAQAQGRDLLQETSTPDGRPVTVVNAGFVPDEGAPGVSGPIPAVGEHTADVLADLGVDASELAELRRQGVIQ